VVVTAGAVVFAAAAGVATAENPVLGAAAVLGFLAILAALFQPKLIAYLLVVTIFTSPITVGGVTVGKLSAPIAFLAVLGQFVNSPTRLHAKGLLAMVFGYVLVAGVSVTWSMAPAATTDSLLTLAASVAGMLAFGFLIRSEKDLSTILWVAAVASMALAIAWTLGYASGADRRYNVTGDPNYFASLQVMALPLILVLASHAKSLGARIFLNLVVAISAGSVVATLSRGGILTLFGTAFVVFVIPSRSLFRSRLQKYALFASAVIGLSLLLAVAWGDLNRRFNVAYEQELAGGRGDLWAAGLQGYKEHPLTGLGFGAFKPISFQLLRQTPGVDLEGHLRFAEGEYMHNAYLGSLVDLGPVGLLFFLGVFAACARTLLRSGRAARASNNDFLRHCSNALAVALLSFAVSSISLSTETSRGLWMLVGLTVAVAALVERETQSLAPGNHEGRATA
jgi:O-antigen ligase